jgi:hypothetical protein
MWRAVKLCSNIPISTDFELASVDVWREKSLAFELNRVHTLCATWCIFRGVPNFILPRSTATNF